MPETEEEHSDPHIPEEASQSDDGVSGRYPTDEEWEDAVQRAESVKETHDDLFRRLAGKDSE